MMPFARLSAAWALGTVVLLAACSRGAQFGQPTFLPTAVTNGAADTGTLVVRVNVGVQPDYLSPSTKAMTLKILGPTKIKKTIAGLTIGANGCKSTLMTLQCALKVPGLTPCPSRKNCYTAIVATYDGYDAKRNAIPPGAHVLSNNEAFGFSIGSGITVVPIVLYGVPRSVAFLPGGDSSLMGTQSAGFVEPKCSAAPQSVTVLGQDIAGNYILGVGAPAVAMTSSAPSQLAVSKSGVNTFVLTPPRAPNYAYGNFTTHLTLTATPNAKTGRKPARAIVNVSYSGDICGIITEFTSPTAESMPAGITVGPDGNLWFTENGAGKVARMTLGGAITEFPIPVPSASPAGIVTGPDNNLWFAEPGSSMIGKITTSGAMTQYPTPTQSASPFFLSVGSDHNLWFTECSASNVAKLTTSGTITEYATPTRSSQPFGITAGPDGNLWFAERSVGQIGEVTTNGAVSEYAIPSGPSSTPFGITTGADGALWFGEVQANNIGRITTAGTVFPEYPVPEPYSFPAFPTLGPDGAVWFSEFIGNRIGRITTAGAFTEYAVPTPASEPAIITIGPDGSLWFTEIMGNKVARLR
jgi:virginiamycin B lyase